MTDRKVISFLQRAGKPGGGKGILATEDRSNCIATGLRPYVCYALEGNGQRQSHHGDGYRTGSMYTLNTVQVHAVVYERGDQDEEY